MWYSVLQLSVKIFHTNLYGALYGIVTFVPCRGQGNISNLLSQLPTRNYNSRLATVTRSSQLATRNSQLATRNLQLATATRNVQLGTPIRDSQLQLVINSQLQLATDIQLQLVTRNSNSQLQLATRNSQLHNSQLKYPIPLWVQYCIQLSFVEYK